MRYLPLFAAIIAITPFAIDLYLPAMPQMARFFGTSIDWVQNSLSIFLAGYATGMFLFGPLADKVGRRPLVLFGLSGFVVISLALTQVTDIGWFIGLRFLQAVVGGAATVVIPGAIRHLFGKDTAKGLSYVSMIMMIAPMIAPSIGGLLMIDGHWQWIFAALGGYGFLMLIVAWFYFPALKIEAGPISEVSFLGRYRAVLTTAGCRKQLLVSMLASLIFFAYITSAPFLFIEIFGFSEAQFGLLFALNVGGLMAASFINTRLVPLLGSRSMLKVCAPLALLAALLLLVSLAWHLPVSVSFFAVMLVTGLMMILIANSDSLILQKFSTQTGTATAVIGTLRFASGALAGPILGLFFNGTALPIAGLMVGASLLIWGMVFLAGKEPVNASVAPDGI